MPSGTDVLVASSSGAGATLTRSYAFERLAAIATVLDANGDIVDTNDAWRLFARLNEGPLATTGTGVNYLDVCDRAAAAGEPDAAAVAAGLRQILAGKTHRYDHEYPCASPTEERWFLVQAAAAPVGDSTGVVLFHVDITASKLRETRFASEAEHDALTGLPNRRGAIRIIEEQLAIAGTTGHPMTLMFLDLDRFKAVNDTYGHHVGDELLVKVSSRTLGAVRVQDQLARIGGDEFVLVCPGLTGDAVAATADRLRSVMGQPFQIGPTEVTIGASIGLAFSSPDATVDSMLHDADAQMYRDKGRRRHRIARVRSAPIERHGT